MSEVEVRVAALNAAVGFYEGAAPSSDAVLVTAAKFEAYLNDSPECWCQ